MIGKLAYKTLDGRTKEYITLEAPNWNRLIRMAEDRVVQSSAVGKWALFSEDNEKIRAGMFSEGVWIIEDLKSFNELMAKKKKHGRKSKERISDRHSSRGGKVRKRNGTRK